MGSPDYVYSDNLDELKENYFNDFIGYQTDGLLSPECIASDNEVSLYLHNYGRAYKDIPVYYAVLENVIDTEYKVDNIIYVSCKPESLARDMGMLQMNGYRLIRAAAVDQFPWTKNVETVCLLSRRKPDDTIKVSVNMYDYYQIRDAEEAEKKPS